MGIDDGDSDKFKIGTSAMGTNTRMTIDASGNVGIGSTDPSAPLEIEGNAEMLRFNSSTHGFITFYQDGDGSARTAYVGHALGSDDDFSIRNETAAGELKLGTNGTDRVIVLGSGDVGIGNLTPTAKLDVDGSAIFNESGAAVDFRIEGDTDSEIFFVDGSADAIGISTTTPVSTLDVQGSMGLKVTEITGATTLDNTHNIVICQTNAFTVTLPAAASHAGKVYYIKNVNTDSDDIVIDGNGAENIDGAATITLFVYKDAVRIVSDGDEWHIIADERIPHKCILSRDAAQSIDDNTETEISFDAEKTDVGELGATGAGNSVTIQRAGTYIINANWNTPNMDDGEQAQMKIYVNGSFVRESHRRQPTTNDGTLQVEITFIATLAAADYIDLFVTQKEGASQNTNTTLGYRPRLSVVEVR